MWRSKARRVSGFISSYTVGSGHRCTWGTATETGQADPSFPRRPPFLAPARNASLHRLRRRRRIGQTCGIHFSERGNVPAGSERLQPLGDGEAMRPSRVVIVTGGEILKRLNVRGW